MEGKGLDFKAVFTEVSNGNSHARDFCEKFLVWAHLLDDFADRDATWPAETIIEAGLDLFLTFAFNPFWQANKTELLPLVMMGVRAWADAEKWQQRESFRDRASADVLKSHYQEVFWYVAKLCGGWEHYSKITAKWRNYHYDVADGITEKGERRRENGEGRTEHHPLKPGDPERGEQIAEMCRGDKVAEQFCWVFMRWVHLVDDMVDADRAWDADQIARVNLEAAVVFSSNEFFQRHKERLTPLVVQGCRAYGDSVKWAQRGDVKDRRAADVLKSFYQEVYWQVTYLVASEQGENGWKHLSAMTEKYRVFDYDCAA